MYKPRIRKTYLLIYAPNENSNQPTHPHCLIRVFVFRLKKVFILYYPKCAQWWFWSACANVQADLNLHWAHMSRGMFSDVMTHSVFSAPFVLHTFVQMCKQLSKMHYFNLCSVPLLWITCRMKHNRNHNRHHCANNIAFSELTLFIRIHLGRSKRQTK